MSNALFGVKPKLRGFGEAEDDSAGQPAVQPPAVQPPTLAVQPPEPVVAVQPSGRPESEYRSRVDRQKMTFRIPKQKAMKYKLYALLHNIDLQDLVEAALDAYTGQPAVQPSSRPNGQPSTYQSNDLSNNSTDDEPLLFYAQLTSNKITAKDRDAYLEVRHLKADVIKAGVVISLQRVKTRINGFRYCIGAIQEIAESPMANHQEYLKYVLSKHEK